MHAAALVFGVHQVLAQRRLGALVVVFQPGQANAHKPRNGGAAQSRDQRHPKQRTFKLQPDNGHARGQRPQNRDERQQSEHRPNQAQPQIFGLAGKAHAVFLNALRGTLYAGLGALPARQVIFGQSLTPSKSEVGSQIRLEAAQQHERKGDPCKLPHETPELLQPPSLLGLLQQVIKLAVPGVEFDGLLHCDEHQCHQYQQTTPGPQGPAAREKKTAEHPGAPLFGRPELSALQLTANMGERIRQNCY